MQLKNVLREESERHGRDEEYEKSMVAGPFNTPPQWGGCCQHRICLVGCRAKDACASGKAWRLAPDSNACHHCKACIPILSVDIFLENCMAGV